MNLINFIWAFGAFLLVVGILVIGHEYGHFWVARKLGVKVLRFSIGFGKPLWVKRGKDGTEYVLAPLPLGGFVRMLDESEGPVAEAELPLAFNRQPIWKRACIVFAGPLANFVLAVLAYWIMFVVGIEGAKPLIGEISPNTAMARAGGETGDLIIEVDGDPVVTWADANMSLLEAALDKQEFDLLVESPDGRSRLLHLDLGNQEYQVDDNDILGFLGFANLHPVLEPVIGKLIPGGRAEAAGLKSGDRLVFADGKVVADWQWWADYVAERPEQAIDLVVERNNEQQLIRLVPEAIEQEQKKIGRIGASPRVSQGWAEEFRTIHRYPFFSGFYAAVGKTAEVTGLTLVLMGKMITGEASIKNVSGPITIAQYAGQSARISFSHFLFMLGLISIGLGILNLLPIPVLDGGHLLYYLVEFFKGSPVSPKALEIGQQGGLVLLFGLITLALYNDFVRWF